MNRKRSNRKRSNRKSRRISRKSKKPLSPRITRIVSKLSQRVKIRSRKARSRKSLKTKSRKNRKAKFGMELNGIITIYGRDSCPGCVRIKEFCNEKSIKYNFIVRDSENDNQNAIINNSKGIEKDYQFIPVIISSNNEFLGGSQQFIDLFNASKKN